MGLKYANEAARVVNQAECVKYLKNIDIYVAAKL